jgi:hypothetical protein
MVSGCSAAAAVQDGPKVRVYALAEEAITRSEVALTRAADVIAETIAALDRAQQQVHRTRRKLGLPASASQPDPAADDQPSN